MNFIATQEYGLHPPGKASLNEWGQGVVVADTNHAPNTFAVGADGLAYVVDSEGDDPEDIEFAAADCPTEAIRVSDGAE
jgi:hypothetical protein